MNMPFLSAKERAFVDAVSRLAYCNPFLPERIDCERAALGPEFVEGEAVWSLSVDRPEETSANVMRIVRRLDPLATELRTRLAAATVRDLALYEDAILYLLYERYG